MSNYKIKEIPISDRPRERLKEVGVENLTDIELLSIILKTGLKNKNVKDLAIECLNNYSLKDLKDISIYELMKIKGIGEVKAIELVSSIELGKRVLLKENKTIKLDNPNSIWKDARSILNGKKQEYFYAYYFNSKQELIERKQLFIGTINSSTTHTREVFKEAYKVSATSIVCLHNHPSNDVTPSKADILFTNSLVETGKIQGIPVVDHIIVGEKNYYSFYEHNKLSN
ncbi:MAG: DNA repair protein RadC [Bacilli bacterium]|nr:DNA repair protein RadC [Bacilli bacterium]